MTSSLHQLSQQIQICTLNKSRGYQALHGSDPKKKFCRRRPGTYGTGSASKLAVVSKVHGLELGHFSTGNNFQSELLRRNEVFALTYVDRIFFPSLLRIVVILVN